MRTDSVQGVPCKESVTTFAVSYFAQAKHTQINLYRSDKYAPTQTEQVSEFINIKQTLCRDYVENSTFFL